MNRILLFSCLLLLFSANSFAQDSIRKKNQLTETVSERFFVLKTDKEPKNGLYQAIYRHKTALATGFYSNNKRAGTWHFYDTHGTLVENFNYDRNVLLYERPDDIASETQIRYDFDNKITDSDVVTKPIKPGGRYYGYIPYIKVFRLSDDFIGTDFSLFTAVLELLVSPGGRLADFKVHIRSEDFERTTTFSTELINDEDKIFIPATINRQPVLSRIFVKCRITDNGELDIN